MTQIDNTRGLDPSINIRSNSQNGLISLSEHPKLESLYNIAQQNFPGNRALKLLGENPRGFDCQQFIELLKTVWDDPRDIDRSLWLSGNKANNSQNWAEVIENLMGNEKPVEERNNATTLGKFIDRLSILGVKFDTNEIENRMKLSQTLGDFICSNNFEILLLKSGFSQDKVAEIKKATHGASYADIATEIFMRAETPGFKLDENPFMITHKMPTGHPILEFLNNISDTQFKENGGAKRPELLPKIKSNLKNMRNEYTLETLAESLYRLFPNQRNAVNVLKQSKSFSSTGNLPFADDKDSKVFWYSFLLKEHNLYAAKQEEIQGNQATRNNFFARFLPSKPSN
jgi:hypothetical protein